MTREGPAACCHIPGRVPSGDITAAGAQPEPGEIPLLLWQPGLEAVKLAEAATKLLQVQVKREATATKKASLQHL